MHRFIARHLSTSCPIGYRVTPAHLSASPLLDLKEGSSLYVVGGLYGNLQALRFIEDLTASHSDSPTVIYNGDFHFFDKNRAVFDEVQRKIVGNESAFVLATAGNVEKEIASKDSVSCGCDYPEYTDPNVTKRSDAIVGLLKVNAEPHAADLDSLPILRRVALTALDSTKIKVGIIHGSLSSLSGWEYAVESVGE